MLPPAPIGRRFLHASAALLLILSVASARESQTIIVSTKEKVGRIGENRYQTPTNQILTPAGVQAPLPGLRPQAIALSPDGRLLVTSGRNPEILVLDPKTGATLQKVVFPGKPVPSESPEKGMEAANVQTKSDGGAQLSLTGLTFSKDGSRLYIANVNGDVKVFSVTDGKVAALKTITLPDARAPKRKAEIPAGLAVSSDGKLLYVAGNLSNKLFEIDVESGNYVRSWDVGVAPFDVALAQGKVYVSNLGGRRPKKGDLTGPAGRGTVVRVDPVRHIANEGSVSIIDLKSGRFLSELMVELHAGALAVSPGEKHVVVANSASDTVSVIDTRTDQIIERIWVREPSELFSATPNALAFDKTGKWLMVCNGTQNAVAMVKFDPADRESKLMGLVPVGWFPGAIAYDPFRKQMCVANIKGIGSTRLLKPGEKPKYNSKDYFGTLSLVPVPSEKELAVHNANALINMRYGALQAARFPARPDQPARPVPERVGEPSVFKHVIYVLKENRCYDQVLGDVKRGNGDASLCIFGEKYTPNQHKLVRQFILLDNAYCNGIQSADGHQWSDSAITNDYTERQHASWPRSYSNLKTDEAFDALAYSSAGFIWDNAIQHGKTFRNYGEACISSSTWSDPAKKNKPGWKDYYRDFVNGASQTTLRCKPGIESLRPYSKLDTVGWDMNVPDVMRAAEFIKELKTFEQKGGMPQLSFLFLPNDHTGGTSPGGPTPGAQVADNDLAFGQVVDAVSHSSFWKDTCIFSVEDDPQSGADHVSGYRSTFYVASAYTKRGQVISTQYNQTSVLHTIELILGLPPMNIMDATATPMSDCFMETADLSPFTAVPNQVPLDQANPEPKKIADRQLRKDAIASSKLKLDEPDRCDEDVLNRILWRAMKGTRIPYPDWAIAKVEDDDD
ncbi:MAG: Phosphoesterase family protein [Chthoniobacteraceae bacterium]|nr:Phosphoesterase family protein [Chthoniobacteraceae bacterium]